MGAIGMLADHLVVVPQGGIIIIHCHVRFAQLKAGIGGVARIGLGAKQVL